MRAYLGLRVVFFAVVFFLWSEEILARLLAARHKNVEKTHVYSFSALVECQASALVRIVCLACPCVKPGVELLGKALQLADRAKMADYLEQARRRIMIYRVVWHFVHTPTCV